MSAPLCLPLLLDLDDLPDVVATQGAPRLQVCARLDGRPVGICTLDAPLDPMPGWLLLEGIERALADELTRRALEPAPVAVPAASLPTATVVVCTRDRPHDLERCLASLGRLRRPLPVVVVDNGSSTPGVPEVVAAAGARYVHEPLPGLDRARNRGVDAVTTEVVLCTDDDVEVDPGWADALLATFADPVVAAATGLVLPAVLDTEPRLRMERYAGFSHRGCQRRVLDGTELAATAAGRAGAGASMAFRTSFLRRIGGFPEELDAGMPTGSGGDTYALYRVLRAGLRIVYEPASIAHHHHRDSDRELVRAARGYFSGAGAYLLHAWRADGDAAALRAESWVLRTVVRDLVDAARGRRVPLDLAVAQARGALDAVPGYVRARRTVAARPSATPALAAPADAATHVLPEQAPAAAPAPVRGATRGDAPAVTVVIPTLGRRDLLLRLLDGLDRQAYDGPLEVVVAIDGDVDGTADAIARRDGRLPVRALHAAAPGCPGGAGAARNLGAEAASGDVLLFLDDDVEPLGADLVTAHVAAHAAAGATPAAVVGPVPPRRWDDLDRHGLAIRNWWADHVRRLDDEAVLTFADVSSGNLSVWRSTLAAAGGFAPLPRREDWELGYRLVTAGAVVVGAPDAAVLHDADLDPSSALRDRRSEGAGDFAFAALHPAATWQLPLALWPDLPRKRRLLVEGLLRGGARHTPRVVEPAAAAGRRPGRRWHEAFRVASFVQYWSGVADEAGGERALAEHFSLARAYGTTATMDLDDPTPWPYPGAEVRWVRVRVAGRPIAQVPMHWGGVPWSSTGFRAAVLHQLVGGAERASAHEWGGPAVTTVLDVDVLDAGWVPPVVHGPVRLLVWAGPQLLGEVTRGRLDPLDHAQLRRDLVDRFAGQLSQLGRSHAAMARRGPLGADALTIVVCTRDRAPMLAGALLHLAQLDPAPAEVIVVDNAPTTDATEQLTTQHGVRRVLEPRPGLDNARNAGWRAATTPLVAYVDDDARPHPRFAAALAGGFLGAQVGAVTGLVVAAELDTPAQRRFEAWGGMRKGFERRVFGPGGTTVGLQPHRLGVGTNMAFRRSLLEELGGFDPRLDVGTPTRGGGDLDMLFRVVDAGHAVVYEPGAVVRHVHRRDWAGLRGQWRDNGVAFAAFLAKYEQSPRHARAARQERRDWHLRWHVQGALGALRRGQLRRAELFLTEAAASRHGADALAQAAEAERAHAASR